MAKQKSKSKGKSKKAKKLPLVPKGGQQVLASLIVHDGKAALAFYKKVLGAKVEVSYDMMGKVGHAELRVGESLFAIADEWPEYGALGANRIGASPVILSVYVKDCDKVAAKAVAAGSTITRPAEDQFWGDRTVQIKDPFGHLWTLSTHKEALTEKEIKARMKKLFA
jgi:PhnB protein